MRGQLQYQPSDHILFYTNPLISLDARTKCVHIAELRISKLTNVWIFLNLQMSGYETEKVSQSPARVVWVGGRVSEYKEQFIER